MAKQLNILDVEPDIMPIDSVEIFAKHEHEKVDIAAFWKCASVNKEVTVAKQLDVFTVEPEIMQFDISKAKVKRGPGNITYTDVRVVVPRNARNTDELPKKTTADDRYETFEEHAMGIWRFNRDVDENFKWEAAEELCKAARDHKEPIPVRIYLGTGFCPLTVVEYLK